MIKIMMPTMMSGPKNMKRIIIRRSLWRGGRI